jgi:histidine ammonia-lyase
MPQKWGIFFVCHEVNVYSKSLRRCKMVNQKRKPLSMTVILNSLSDFTLEHYKRVVWNAETVELGDKANKAIVSARSALMVLIEKPDVTIYGVNTGYGGRAKIRLNALGRMAQAQQPTHHRAASWGEALPDRVTRGIVFARLANFIEGHSAVSPAVAQKVVDMLSGSSLPYVPARGQGGAGEILSLSHVFLEASKTWPLAEKDMLALVNGSPAASALTADAALATAPRLQLALEVFALAAEAFNTPQGHFAEELETCWNNPHDAWALRHLRELMQGGSEPRRPYQTPVSIRILPRILGQAHRALMTAEEVAQQSLAAVSDNPVVFPPGQQRGTEPVVSTGGYHNMQAAAALDGLVCAHTNLAVLTGRIAAKLLDGTVSLLPPYLGYEDGASYLGCLPMAIVGYEEEMRMLSMPTLLPGSESGGFGQDDVASPVFLAWQKYDKSAVLFEQCLSSLAPIAVRALRVTGRQVPTKLQALLDQTQACFPDDATDRAMGYDIAKLALAFRQKIYARSA